MGVAPPALRSPLSGFGRSLLPLAMLRTWHGRRAASLGELRALSADAAKRPARGAENVLAFIGLDTAIDKQVTNWN